MRYLSLVSSCVFPYVFLYCFSSFIIYVGMCVFFYWCSLFVYFVRYIFLSLVRSSCRSGLLHLCMYSVRYLFRSFVRYFFIWVMSCDMSVGLSLFSCFVLALVIDWCVLFMSVVLLFFSYVLSEVFVYFVLSSCFRYLVISLFRVLFTSFVI